LGEPLDPEERADLVIGLLRKTVTSAQGAHGVASVSVVSRDPDLLRQARSMGAATLLQKSEGLNEGLDEARTACGGDATALLVLPADLPGVTSAAIEKLIGEAEAVAGRTPGRPVVVLAPDRHGSGTNALLLSPPGVIPFLFGERSRAAHSSAAAGAGASYVEVGGPLAFDLDTADDLLEADMSGLSHEAGR
jgi:2-phospho-L-lactate guanylyltransferase